MERKTLVARERRPVGEGARHELGQKTSRSTVLDEHSNALINSKNKSRRKLGRHLAESLGVSRKPGGIFRLPDMVCALPVPCPTAMGSAPRHGLARAHITMLLAGERGLGVCVMNVPERVMPDVGEDDGDPLLDALGISLRQRFRNPTDAMLKAALTAVLMDSNATAAIRRTDRLLRESPQEPMMRSSEDLRDIVEACATTERFEFEEFGFVKEISLSELLAEHDDLWIAGMTDASCALLVARAKDAGVWMVAPSGHGASVLCFRLAEWMAPTREQAVDLG